MKYSVYDGYQNNNYKFKSKKEALNKAQELIDSYLEDGLWGEGVEEITVSKTIYCSTAINLRSKPENWEEDEEESWQYCDYKCDYILKACE